MENKIPEFLYKKLIEQYGIDLTYKIIEGFSKKRVTTLRVNKLKTTETEIKNILKENQVEYKEVAWSDSALIVEDIEKIRKLDIYEKGFIYLQSLSSMLPVIVLNPKEGENILDMAAAPGGKTCQIASLTFDKALITACEKNKIRYDRLKYNLKKQGVNKVTVLMEDARKLDEFFSFKKILLDAPCSGSGTIFLDDGNLFKVFTEQLIERSKKTQLELLKKAISILKPGGELVYSTCSILKEENEDNLSEILKNKNIELVKIESNQFKGVELLPTDIEGTICVCPNELYEGFFISKVRKK